MTSTLDPYLNFRGNAREAMEFYRDVFGAELVISTFKEFGAAQDPAEDDLVMHADLRGPGAIHFMGSDVPERMEFRPGSNFAMSLQGESADEAELRGYFDRLAAGGTVTMPLERAVWGATFGMLTDRFGIGWMVNIAPEGGDRQQAA